METRSASFKRAEAAFQSQNRLWNKRVQSVDSASNSKAKEKRTFEIQYQIEYPPTLVLEKRRNQHNPDAEASPALAAPASPGRLMPSPRKAYDLKQDIQQLEDSF